MEEMAHCEEELFFQQIAPTLVTGAAFIGITTISPDGDVNFVNRLASTKNEEGEPVFNVVEVSMVCETCRAEGKVMECKHKLGEMPEWQSGERQKDIQAMMATESETFAVEMRGVVMDAMTIPAFDPPSVEWLKKPGAMITADEIRETPEYVFTTIDPNAGGHSSDYAIVSCIYMGGKMIIVGAESMPWKRPQDAMTGLMAHILEYRKIPLLKSTTTILIPESNLGQIAQWVDWMIDIQGLTRIVTMKEDANLAGMRTSNLTKFEMATAFDNLLSYKRVRFFDDFITLTEKKTPTDMQDMCITQLGGYARKTIASKRMGGKNTVIYTGKHNGKDDLSIALQMNPYMKEVFYAKLDRYHKMMRAQANV